MLVLFRKYQNNNRQSKGFGKWYARTIQPSTIDTDGLAKIMQANCTVRTALKNLIIMQMNKDSWSKIIHIIIMIFTAIATTVGMTSCTGHGPFYGGISA